MSVWLVAGASYQGESIEPLLEKPDFRRATRNMILSYVAVQKLNEKKPIDWNTCALVVATAHGEFQATRDFLWELERTSTARPLLFQNSLHNSTVGFLSRMFQARGPVFTISDGNFSGERGLELARELLETGVVRQCVVVGVDGKVSELGAAALGEGAGAVLMTSEQSGGLPCPEFQSITEKPYGSHAIEQLATRVQCSL